MKKLITSFLFFIVGLGLFAQSVTSVSLSRSRISNSDQNREVTVTVKGTGFASIAAKEDPTCKIQVCTEEDVKNYTAKVNASSNTASATVTIPSFESIPDGGGVDVTVRVKLCGTVDKASAQTVTVCNPEVTEVLLSQQFIQGCGPEKDSKITVSVSGSNFDVADSVKIAFYNADDKIEGSPVEVDKKSFTKDTKTFDASVNVPDADGYYKVCLLLDDKKQDPYSEMEIAGSLSFDTFTIPESLVADEDSVVKATIKGNNFESDYVKAEDFTVTCKTASIVSDASVKIKSNDELEVRLTVPGKMGKYEVEVAYGKSSIKGQYCVWNFVGEENFVKVPGTTIKGGGSWTPDSHVFVKGRAITINSFYMYKHPVTRSEYKEIMGRDTSYGRTFDKDGNEVVNEKNGWDKVDPEIVGKNPVNYVSWGDAIKYCNYRSMKEGLTPCYTVKESTDPDVWEKYDWNDEDVSCDFKANGYRLPTEAEWEWAARGGDQPYTYVGSNKIEEVAWYHDNTKGYGTVEVESKKPNGYGLYDMSGNVWEWCWDLEDGEYKWNEQKQHYEEFVKQTTPATGPTSGNRRVLRGGSYESSESSCSVSDRTDRDPEFGWPDAGFRIVRNAQ